MRPYILAALALFVLQTLLAPTIRYLMAGPGVAARLRIALGPRDDEPPLSPIGGRAARALANMHEALPVFLTLALLIEIRGTPLDLARPGAAIWLIARALYVPVYLAGVPGLRSTIWVGSWIGLAAMIAAVIG